MVNEVPAKSGSLYFNYKKTFSVVLLVLDNANYHFIWVDVGSYGKNSSSGSFTNSKQWKYLDNEQLNVPEDPALPGTDVLTPYVKVGGEGFPLKRNSKRSYQCSQTKHNIEEKGS